eukprot:gene12071-14123_t
MNTSASDISNLISSPHPDDAAEAPSISSPSCSEDMSGEDDDIPSPPQHHKFSSLSINSSSGKFHKTNSNIVPKSCVYNKCCICAYGPPPSFFTSAPTWADICYIALYCLTLSKPEIKYFHIKKDICTFIDAHYETMCMRKRTSIWRQTVNMTLSHPQYFEMFQQESALENGRKGYYGLKQMHDPYEHTALNKRSRRKRRHEQKMIQEELKKTSPYSKPVATSGSIFASSSPTLHTSSSFKSPSTPSSSSSMDTDLPSYELAALSQQCKRLKSVGSKNNLFESILNSDDDFSPKRGPVSHQQQQHPMTPGKTVIKPYSPLIMETDIQMTSFSNSANNTPSPISRKYNKPILPKLDDDDDELMENEREVPNRHYNKSPMSKLVLEKNLIPFSTTSIARSTSPSPMNSRSNSPCHPNLMGWGSSNAMDDEDFDDDDDDEDSPKKRMRKTTRPEEKIMLEKYYQLHYGSNAKHCKEELLILSSTLNWKINRIQRWLDNRRTKDKLKTLRASQELYGGEHGGGSHHSHCEDQDDYTPSLMVLILGFLCCPIWAGGFRYFKHQNPQVRKLGIASVVLFFVMPVISIITFGIFFAIGNAAANSQSRYN